MRRDDRDDPFDDLFDEIERMMNDIIGEADVHIDRGRGMDTAGETGDLHVDIYEKDDHLRVIADLPGVQKEAIDLKCDGKWLTIDAEGEHRSYNERVSLPTRVDEHTADASYNNGILEVVFETADDSAAIDLG